MASVESVKAASDVYAPVSGTVIEANAALGDNPALVNASAEGDAWFVKLEVSAPADADKLMDAAAYKQHCDANKH
jgi:glycine cleavage system H protein